MVRDAAYAAGIAAWLRAIPQLEARGRVPLLDGRSEAVRTLAQDALDRLGKARKHRGQVSRRAVAALLHVGQAKATLRAAVADPQAVAEGRLPDVEQADRISLALRALTGCW